MNRLSENKKLVITVTILLAAFFLQPAGRNLKFCFGDDGHFDVSPESFHNFKKIYFENLPETASGDHHENCLDLTSSIDGKISCRINPEKNLSDQTVNRLYVFPSSLVLIDSNRKSSDEFYSQGYLFERCSFIPAFLSSIILLI